MGSIIIQGRIPSKKNSKKIFAIRGRIIIAPSTNYEAWHKDALWQLKGKEKIETDYLELHFYMPDNRKCDLTNKAESIMDTLVDAGILEDDCWQVIPNLRLKFEAVDKLNPRCEIIW